MESLFTWLEAAGKETALFLVSMLPLVELRGAVPLGVAAGMPWYEILPICYLGNLLPIPFLLLFTERLLDWLARMPGIKGAANWYTSKLNSKKAQITKYAKWGLFLFVAVPLPGTGAWSGA
ncbi:MAG: COG2426 family protein, partial [Butyricicoccus sp.]